MNGQALKNMQILGTADGDDLTKLAAITSTAAEVNKLDGAGAIVASGTQSATISDIATDANGTLIATAVNALIAALDAFDITATS